MFLKEPLPGNVTFTFKRIPIDESKLPQDIAAGTWWCAQYQISTNPPNVNFLKQIFYSMPSRRPTPVGLAVRGFTSADGNAWQEGAGKLPQLGFGVFGFGSPCFSGPFGHPTCGCVGFNCGFGGFGAFGIAQSDRTVGAISGATLSQGFGTAIKPSQIVDGTSNTIIAILIGIR